MTDGFCVSPWINMHLHPTGTIRPCCISQKVYGDIKAGDTLESAWSSDVARELRQEFMSGGRPQSCRSCYEKEDSGVESVRMQLNARYIHESTDVTTDSPGLDRVRQLDISFTNDCNLHCKMCSPHYSTGWIKVARELQTDGNPLWSWYTKKQERFELKASQLAEQIKKLPNVTDLEIKGGEPFISKQHGEFLEQLGESNRANSLVFRYVTNGTHVPPALLGQLEKFNRKYIWVSVDGAGELLKYIRGGRAELKQIENNIRMLSRVSRTHIGVVFTLSIYNLYGIRDFWAWYKRMLLELPELDIFMGMVRYPNHICVDSFPQDFIRAAAKLIPDEDHPFLHSLRTVLLNQGTEEMPAETLKKFQSYTSTLEQHFKESIVAIHPEFSQILFMK